MGLDHDGGRFASMIAAVPLFMRIARDRSKREAYSLAMLGRGCHSHCSSWRGSSPGVPEAAQVLLVMAIVGMPQAGVFLFPTALTADLADSDAMIPGCAARRRTSGPKTLSRRRRDPLTPLVLLVMLMLGRTANDPLGIRLVGPVAGTTGAAGWWLFRAYQLPDEIEPVVMVAELRPSMIAEST